MWAPIELMMLRLRATFAPAPPRPIEALPRAEHVIVVFGCAARDDGTPSPGLTRRLEQALGAARRDPSAVLVLTGGAVASRVPEAEAMRRWLVGHGVDAGRLVLEPTARFTVENAELAAPLIRRIGAKKVTLVTERFHMPRSHYLMTRALVRRGIDDVMVCDDDAPDALGRIERLTRAAEEKAKLMRDAAGLALRHRKLGFEFDASLVSRNAERYSHERAEWVC